MPSDATSCRRRQQSRFAVDAATKKRLMYDAQMYQTYRASRKRSNQLLAQFHLGRFAGAWDCLSEADKTDWLVAAHSGGGGKSQIRQLADAVERWVVHGTGMV